MSLDCAICYRQCDYKTPCHHHFHKRCLRRWTDKKYTCPICNRILKYDPTPIYKIFNECCIRKLPIIGLSSNKVLCYNKVVLKLQRVQLDKEITLINNNKIMGSVSHAYIINTPINLVYKMSNVYICPTICDGHAGYKFNDPKIMSACTNTLFNETKNTLSFNECNKYYILKLSNKKILKVKFWQYIIYTIKEYNFCNIIAED